MNAILNYVRPTSPPGAAVTGAVAGTFVGTSAMGWYGFTSAGVAANTAAAAWQSSIGNVVTGSTFAVLQSYGATGVAAKVLGATFGGIGLVGGFAVAYYLRRK